MNNSYLLLFCLFLLSSCEKEVTYRCEITEPSHLSTFTQGDSININIETLNIEDELITYYLDSTVIGIYNLYHDNFSIGSSNITIGEHNLKTITYAPNNMEVSHCIIIKIIPVDPSSLPPTAQFNSSTTNVYAGDPVSFYDHSENNPSQWYWDFGNETYSDNQNPIIVYNTIGVFSVSLKATNINGSDSITKPAYINVITPPVFCPESFYDQRDGRTYKAIEIGDQCWMAENLKTGEFLIGDSMQKDNGIIEKYFYNDDSLFYYIYGGLYQWDEMMQYNPSDENDIGITQGICPDNWHIPSKNEWHELAMFLDSYTYAGGKLKEVGTEHWNSPNFGATNETGFTGLPSGSRKAEFFVTYFHGEGNGVAFWTSTEHSSETVAYYRSLSNSSPELHAHFSKKENGYSVRCIKNKPD